MSQFEHAGMYHAVDQTEDPGVFIGLMDQVAEIPGVGDCRDLLVEGLRIGPGQAVLDLGCGPGDHTRDVAALVGPGGSVVGVDFSAAMIAEATRRQEAGGVPASFEEGDAQKLRFDDATFDACRTERMLCHVTDATAALAEMIRVTRPGGRVGVIDTDMAGFIIDPPETEVTRAVQASFVGSFQSPWIGRQLRRLMMELGLVDVTLSGVMVELPYPVAALMLPAHAALIPEDAISAEALQGWLVAQEDARRAGTSYMGLPLFVATGRKP